jgi:hypothetical protein
MEKLGKSGIWGDKNPGYVYRLDKIIQLFPNARIIHVVRDGRAVFSSGLRANRIKLDLGIPAKFPGDAFLSYLAWRKALSSAKGISSLPNFFEIKYEDLLDRPAVMLRELCKFINVRFEDQMLKYYSKNKAQKLVPKHRIHWHMNTLRSLDSERVSAWHEELPKKQLLQYELIGRNKLKEYGYQVNISVRHLFALDLKFVRFILRVVYASLPTPLQNVARRIYQEYKYTQNVRLRVQIRRIRETWAALNPVRLETACQRPRVVYMTGMPRTGTSLSKNYLGAYHGLKVIRFQMGGFMYAWKAAEQPDAIVIDKATHYIRSLRKIHRAYGNQVAFYCLVRDPRDELVSLLERSIHREIHRDERFWRQWARTYNAYLEFAKSVAEPRVCYLMRYEDLVRWPVEAKISFLTWLGLDVHAGTITPGYSVSHKDDIQDWKVKDRQTVTTLSIGQWRKVNDPQVQTLLTHWQRMDEAAALMNRLGYTEDGVVDHPLKLAGVTVFQQVL